jgi:hypothetical protein
MKTILDKDKMSLAQCRKILNKDGKKYTDEEIILVRNWIYHVAEFTLAFVESRTKEEILRIKEILKSKNEIK